MGDRIRQRLVIEGGTPAVDVDIKAFKPIPESGIADAIAAMQAGRTFRYGPKEPVDSQVSLFERDFAAYLGVRHAVAVNSCGAAMFIALRIAGLEPGDRVLLNAFTFTAVPSAIHHAGGVPLLVESGRDWTIDIADLEKKAREGDAKVLLLSYMRGHVPNIDEVLRICRENDLYLIEDCAHALCTTWKGTPMGRFGQIACFSTQSSKALSSGEGGLLCSNDSEVAAKAILYSGSYEKRWSRHFDVPEACSELQAHIPGYSMRMTEMVGAMLRPQVPRLGEISPIHRANNRRLKDILAESPNIDIPPLDDRIEMLGDTIQFHLVGLTAAQADRFVELGAMENIPMQIFGSGENARDFRWWKYLPEPPPLPMTERTIQFSVDLCLGPHLDETHIEAIGDALLRILDWIVAKG